MGDKAMSARATVGMRYDDACRVKKALHDYYLVEASLYNVSPGSYGVLVTYKLGDSDYITSLDECLVTYGTRFRKQFAATPYVRD